MVATWMAEQLSGEDSPDADGVAWSTAACRSGGAMLELFFSEEIDSIAEAKAVCAGCPVQAPCLAGAVQRREPWGVWGGQLFQNGQVLAFKRRRGRPPKNAPNPAQLTA